MENTHPKENVTEILMTNQFTHKDTQKIFEEVFSGSARDENAQRWRKQQEGLIAAIVGESDNSHPSIISNGDFRERSQITEDAANSFYSKNSDPKDRSALLTYIAQSCVILDRQFDSIGMSVAHLLSGRLMQAWSFKGWGDTTSPEWANDLLVELWEAQLDFGDGLTQDVAVSDVQSFLDGLREDETIKSLDYFRGHANGWNRQTYQACIAWRILASVRPEFVPKNLVDGVEQLEKGYSKSPKHLEVQQCANAAWDRYLLENTGGVGAHSDRVPQEPDDQRISPKRKI
jgi:hypothetical protein